MEDYIEKLKSGDEKAFERLVRENQNRVYAVCLSMMKNAHDAQDAAQEAFIKAYRSLKGFKGDSKVETWLTRIAVNACLDALRARRDTESIDERYDLASEDTPETELEKNNLRREVRKALNSLPPDMKSVIVLRDVEGYSYEEVSEILGINIGTVRSRLFRARERLKNIFCENRELF